MLTQKEMMNKPEIINIVAGTEPVMLKRIDMIAKLEPRVFSPRPIAKRTVSAMAYARTLVRAIDQKMQRNTACLDLRTSLMCSASSKPIRMSHWKWVKCLVELETSGLHCRERMRELCVESYKTGDHQIPPRTRNRTATHDDMEVNENAKICVELKSLCLMGSKLLGMVQASADARLPLDFGSTFEEVSPPSPMRLSDAVGECSPIPVSVPCVFAQYLLDTCMPAMSVFKCGTLRIDSRVDQRCSSPYVIWIYRQSPH